MVERDHLVVSPNVLYVGTPVMLLCTQNPDGSPNIAPASSYWALGQMLGLGLLSNGQTLKNLLQCPALTINFPSPYLWGAVEAIADTTASNPVPAPKAGRYSHEPDKFARSGLTMQASDLVSVPRVLECDLQFEAQVLRATPGLGDYHIVEAEVLRVHASPTILIPGTHHIDPGSWEPTIYSFRHYFGLGIEHGHRPTSETAATPRPNTATPDQPPLGAPV